MFLFSKKLSSFLVLLFVFNIFVSTNHFGHHQHTFNPETGQIEHTHHHDHEHACEHHDHKDDPAPDSYLPVEIQHEHHDVCGILNQMLVQFLKTYVAELVFTETSLTPYLKKCVEKVYLISDILSFAPKLSPTGIDLT